MKILHILAGKDTPAFAEKMIASLKASGVTQSAVAAADTPAFAAMKKLGIPLAPWVLAPPFPLPQRLLLRFLVAREKPDIIHCWTRRGAELAGKRKGGIERAAGGAERISPHPASRAPFIVGWLNSYDDVAAFAGCAHLAGATKDIVRHIVKNGVAPTRAHFLPAFVEISAAPPVDRAALATPRDAKVLLALSRLHPHNGLDLLLAALETLPGCVVWLAGEGPLRRALETAARKRGVIGRVRFLGRRDDHAALLRAADICVVPSRAEHSVDAVLEAWAAGTPVVAGAKALIENDVTGLLAPAADAPAFVAALRRAFGDESLRRTLVAQGYAAYIKDYARESATRRWITFYKELGKEKRTGEKNG